MRKFSLPCYFYLLLHNSLMQENWFHVLIIKKITKFLTLLIFFFKRSSLESKGHIQVCLRIRPFTPLERENGSQVGHLFSLKILICLVFVFFFGGVVFPLSWALLDLFMPALLVSFEQDCVSLEDSTNIVLKPPQRFLNRLSEKTSGPMFQKFTFSQVNVEIFFKSSNVFKLFLV